MSGNWAPGMRNRAISPASVIMTAMTTANRGRSTKTEENHSVVRPVTRPFRLRRSCPRSWAACRARA